MAYGYDKKVDYTALINKDIENQDWRSAAIHEAQRNEKILGEGLTQYSTTNHYSAYLPKQEAISSGMDKLAQGSEWKYDAKNDPAMQSYRKQYLREADRATRDTLGSYAGMTGGVPSTAAVAAAQQAGNYQRSQLADKIPELMQADYSRYMQGREADRADLSLLASLDRQGAQDSLELQQWDWTKKQQDWENQRQQEQQLYQNALNRWATLGYADEQVSAALGVPVGTTTSDQRYQEAQLEYQNWQRQQQERSTAYERAMVFLSIGQVPDDATLAAAGLTREQAQQLANYYAGQLTGGNGGKSANPSYTNRTPRGPGGDDLTDDTVDPSAAEWAINYVNESLDRARQRSEERRSQREENSTGGAVPQNLRQDLLDWYIQNPNQQSLLTRLDSMLKGNYSENEINTVYQWILNEYAKRKAGEQGIYQN